MTAYERDILQQWMDRCEVQALEIRVLEGELLEIRKLAFSIWCRDFERLKADVRAEQGNAENVSPSVTHL